MKYFFAAAICLFFARTTLAHDPDTTNLTLRLSATELRATALLPKKATAPEISVDGTLVDLEIESRQLDADGKSELITLAAPLSFRPSTLTVVSGGRTLLAVYEDGALRQQSVLETAKKSLTIRLHAAAQTTGSVFAQFFAAGLNHLIAGPDHLLFLLGLLLLGGGLRRLLKIVTAFTLAHSITLACAALGLWQPAATTIEPLIALSIVCVGAENLLAKKQAHDTKKQARDLRVGLAFGFGLIHGFGFAGPLIASGLPKNAIAVSLLAFNLGIEFAQCSLVLLTAPLLNFWQKKHTSSYAKFAICVAVLVICAGTFWFVRRVLGLE
jgi:hydrogenase/urease accessory protein HupE